jgi:CHAT domain-containing protein
MSMHKLLSVILLLVCIHHVDAQQDVQARFETAFSNAKEKNYKTAIEQLKQLESEAPMWVNVHLVLSWSYIFTGEFEQAKKYADNALLIDQLYHVPYYQKAYISYILNDPQADLFLKTGIWLSADEVQKDFERDLDELIAAGISREKFQQLRSSSSELFRSRDRSYLKTDALLVQGLQAAGEKNAGQAVQYFQRAVESAVYPAEFSQFRGIVLYAAGYFLTNSGFWNEAQPFFESAIPDIAKHRSISPLWRTTLAARLGSIYESTYQTEKALTLLNAYYRFTENLPPLANQAKAEFLNNLIRLEQSASQKETLIRHANLLIQLSVPNPVDGAYYRSTGYAALGWAYNLGGTSAERQQALRFYEQALKSAEDGGLEDQSIGIKTEIANVLFAMGNRNETYQFMESAAASSLARKNYSAASIEYNNLAFMYYTGRDLPNAVKNFRKAIEIVEEFRNAYTGEARLNFLADGIGSYQQLVATLAEMGDAKGVFETQNLERGRVLSELLSHNSIQKNISLAEFQQSLKPDEGALIYTIGEPGTVIINLVTSRSAVAVHNFKKEVFARLKQTYIDALKKAADKPGYKPVVANAGSEANDAGEQITAGDMDDLMNVTRELLQTPDRNLDGMRTEFLRSYYEFLIQPVVSKLTGVKKLIVMPDGVLNFLPFEALRTGEGKFLVESFDIRYVQSAEVKRIIEKRVYGKRSKAFLGMGGAKYENMKETAERVRGVDKLLELQSRANANAIAGKSQREIYAALGFSQLNYLPGTLEEVTAIGRYFITQSDIYTGSQMTENFIKSLSASGAIKNYRIIHLATHGFAVPQIPQLSGIAMCILPETVGGEDGYLTAPEISRLGMQADLAVLSACETGLGKIYGGEGVAGLTQSLLVGGANAALVSLWPVSDVGTMHFMTGLYKLTEKEGKSYDEAVNIMKRKFIAGEFGDQLRNTEIWAPFVIYGK